MMNFEKYKNTLKYPLKPHRICPCGKSFGEKDNFCSNCGADVGILYKEIITEYKVLLHRYRRKEGELFNLFKEDALDYVGLSDHPKKDKFFSFAWDHGHSEGYNAVIDWLEELEDLV